MSGEFERGSMSRDTLGIGKIGKDIMEAEPACHDRGMLRSMDRRTGERISTGTLLRPGSINFAAVRGWQSSSWVPQLNLRDRSSACALSCHAPAHRLRSTIGSSLPGELCPWGQNKRQRAPAAWVACSGPPHPCRAPRDALLVM
jgi:hypothetical protein